MIPKDYIQFAKRTESGANDPVIVDPLFLQYAFEMFVSSSYILDQIKKNVFYKKEIDDIKILRDLENIENNASLVGLRKKEGNNQNSFNISPKTSNFNPRIFHAIVGIATESGELIDEVSGDNVSNIVDEVGDLMWYIAILLDTIGVSFEEVMSKNIDKLKVRYPDKFSNENAINRDLEKEKDVFK